MLHAEHEMQNWKKEQISYFRQYLDVFARNSNEYHIVSNGIRELEDLL